MKRLAILAGRGALPQQIAVAHPKALFVHFSGLDIDLPANETTQASYERFGALFDGLKAAGVSDVVFGGALIRPTLNPLNFDAKMMQLAPGFLAAMAGGDDGLLRAVITAFEDEGFSVRGAHELVDGLTADTETLTKTPPDPQSVKDSIYGQAILEALGPLDVAQGCVVAGGVCFGIETIQGTDEMLRFVAATRLGHSPPRGGVFIKRSKIGQDMRIDMPAIGPDTIDAVVAAGLGGICIEAGRVLMLDKTTLIKRAEEMGITIWATP